MINYIFPCLNKRIALHQTVGELTENTDSGHTELKDLHILMSNVND